jgi:hypothetical protein
LRARVREHDAAERLAGLTRNESHGDDRAIASLESRRGYRGCGGGGALFVPSWRRERGLSASAPAKQEDERAHSQ